MRFGSIFLDEEVVHVTYMPVYAAPASATWYLAEYVLSLME